MIVTLNTGLVNQLTVDTYHLYSPDDMYIDSEDLKELGVDSEDDAWDKFSMKKYMNLMVEKFKQVYENEPLIFYTNESDTGIDLGLRIVSVGTIESPREYNFSTDTLDFDLDINIDKCIGFVEAFSKEQFGAWLKEKFTSCDGFMSFTANNYDDWLEKFKQGREQEVGAFLEYYAELEDMQQEFSEHVGSIAFYECVE